MKKTETIEHHPNYKVAEEDYNFLVTNYARPMRLGLDYMKAEMIMENLGIEYTIVVFGGTRIIESKKAEQKLTYLKKEFESSTDKKAVSNKIKIANQILKKSKYYDIAREFGSLVGKSGKGSEDTRVTLMTGGGPGIMEAANRGAYDVGAKSIGLNITLPREQFPNKYITPELCFQFHYFTIRKMHFMQRAKGLVVFPGGYGTLDEVFELMTLVQTKSTKPLPIIFVGKEYWQKLINFEFLAQEGVINYEDLEIFSFAQTAQEAWDTIIEWHKKNETPLFG